MESLGSSRSCAHAIESRIVSAACRSRFSGLEVRPDLAGNSERARARVADDRQFPAVRPAPEAFHGTVRHDPVAFFVTFGVPDRRAAMAADVVRNPQRHARARRHFHHRLLQRRFSQIPSAAKDTVDASREVDSGSAVAPGCRQAGCRRRHVGRPVRYQILADNAAGGAGERR